MENIEGKYFIDEDKYNCPFCKTRNVKYVVLGIAKFNEKKDKYMYAVFVECSNCHNVSMHLIKKEDYKSFEFYGANSLIQKCNFYILNNGTKELTTHTENYYNYRVDDILHKYYDTDDDKLPTCEDENIILSIPTSFFTIDDRIPRKFRDLIDEAEKCIQNNCLTGASACIRKTIYEFLLQENATGNNYDEKIKSLKGKYKTLDDSYIDMISGIQGIMCDQVHESTIYENFTSQQAKGYIEILKEIFNHFYVLPQEANAKKSKIDALVGMIQKQK